VTTVYVARQAGFETAVVNGLPGPRFAELGPLWCSTRRTASLKSR
jgi:hypothetical protein